MEKDLILQVQDLNIEFHDHLIPETVVYDFDLELKEGEIVGLVGESGSGKSMSALAIAGLLSRKDMKKRGRILFNGIDILTCERNVLRKIQGNDIGIIFQEPMTSLNPLKKIGWQVEEALRIHTELSKEERYRSVIEMLRDVELEDAERIYNSYPHELSGGMRQRVMIAAAMICNPKLLIADEPTTALDVTIQAQILQLIRDLQKKLNLTTIYITHDLGVVANVADRIAVMYAGDIIEVGGVNEIFYDPRHPYTWALLSSLPQLGIKGQDLYSIVGTPPNLQLEIKGDAFAPRNPYALNIDFVKRPPFFDVTPTHKVRTWLMDPRAPKLEPPEAVKRLADGRL